MKKLFCIAAVVYALLAQPLLSESRIDRVNPAGLASVQDDLTLNPSESFRDIALIVTENFETDNTKRDLLLNAVDSIGGHVYLVYPPNVMVGRVPSALHGQLGRTLGIKFVTNAPISAREVDVRNPNALDGLHFFNWVASGEKIREDESVKGIPFPPLKEFVGNAWEQTKPFSSLPGLKLVPMHHTAFPNDVMDGLVKVDVMYVESNGSIDANQYTWTVTDHNRVANWTSAGFYWWVEIANLLGIQPALTYIMHFNAGSAWQQQQGYEPITRNGLDDFLWMNPILANHGFATGDKFQRVRAFNQNRRIAAGAKNGFSAWVVYNPPGAPATHSDGWYAFAWYGDYVKMNFQNNGYALEQYPRIFAHEMGHVFWACDEYAPQCATNCSNCYTVGPRPASMNWNCEYCTPGGPTSCLMHSLTDYNWINHSTCEHTRRQMGWPY